jgi:pyruvate-ferredoxin/flavodoxin oxidoreductase
VVALVMERRKYWRTLQHLSGQHIDGLHVTHRAELEHWQTQYQESVKGRESSLDSIARAMSELAASSNAPTGFDVAGLVGTAPAAPTAAAQANGSRPVSAGLPTISEEDMAKCTNCKTCYQDLGEIFEKTRIVVDGTAKEVGRVIPGALERVAVTPDLIGRATRVAANCDAEIIR